MGWLQFIYWKNRHSIVTWLFEQTWFLSNVVAQQTALDVFSGVCLFVDTITFERANTGGRNLAGRCIAQKSPQSLNVGVIAPAGAHPKNVALGYYDVWTSSAGCIVSHYFYKFFKQQQALSLNSRITAEFSLKPAKKTNELYLINSLHNWEDEIDPDL